MPAAFLNLLALRERFDDDVRQERYNPAALHTLRLQCRQTTALLCAEPHVGNILNTELGAFTVLRLVWRIKRYLQAYNRMRSLPWGEVHELYELKHALLAYIISAPGSPWCCWELGQATDIRSTVSVRLYFTGARPWNTLVHWPMRHIPFKVQQVIRVATGSWPPPDYITDR